jgi:hypothetical protein
VATANRNMTQISQASYDPLTAAKKKQRQTPYKPRISTVIKWALEDSLKETRQSQSYLEDMYEWLVAEHKRRDELLARISTLAPLDHRMQELLEDEKESLLRIGLLDHMVAGMTQSLMRQAEYLTKALSGSVEVAAPRERKNDERQQ